MQSPPGPPGPPPFGMGASPSAPPPPPQQYGGPGPHYAPAYVAAPSNGIGTAAGVLGIVGAVLMFIPFVDFIAVVLGLLAVVFGAVGLSRAKNLGGAGRGMAITGIVLGIVAVAISFVFIAAIYGAVHHLGGQ